MGIVQLIRSLLSLVAIPIVTAISSLALLFMALVVRAPADRLQAVPHFWGKTITDLAGVTVTVRGREKLDPAKAYIFAANHLSMFDIFTLQGYLGFGFRWLPKKELFSIPLFGKAMLRSGAVPIDRAHGRQALKSLDEAAERIASGTSVVIFPEGTRSRDGKLQPFKPGVMVLAIKAGVPLVPVAIKGTYEVLPKGKFLVRSGAVEIRIGEPVDLSGYKMKQKGELAERLHNEVEKLLNMSG